MVSTGMGGNNLGLFVPPMTRELGISQIYFGWAYSARLIGFCTTSWYIGILLDRYGARIPMAVTGIMAGLVMVGLTYLQAGAGWQHPRFKPCHNLNVQHHRCTFLRSYKRFHRQLYAGMDCFYRAFRRGNGCDAANP